jgi:SAM-dependent methyltransferase
VKGIAQAVPDADIPRQFIGEYLEAKEEIQVEHIEEDLEAERVVSLYFMNHYLRAGSADSARPWWKNGAGLGSPLIDQLVREHWDRGPFAQIAKWATRLSESAPLDSVVELGCGVGGLSKALGSSYRFYLGVDSSFASIALGRHLALGVPYQGRLRIPNDLLQSPVSASPKFTPPSATDGRADLVVGDLESLPVARGQWDLSIALNAIDMLPEPALLPKLQHELLKKQGIAIQSCPYVWHEEVARNLRKRLPRGVRDSAQAVEWLYEQAEFRIEEKVDHLPWLFFKHVRQLEIYSVHVFVARALDAQNSSKIR